MGRTTRTRGRSIAACFLVACTVVACGGAATPGLAVGRVGRGLAAHADSVPRGAQVCALRDALAAQQGGPEKPLAEVCAKATKSDELWHRSMIVLGAHAETLAVIASGKSDADTGKLEAALTGVHSPDWVDVDELPERNARAAVVQLVDQMNANASKGDLGKAVADAAPHVKTLCDGLVPYLDAQRQGLEDAQKEAEKRRVARTDRRCTSIDNRPVCVPDSASDRVVYASAYGELAGLARAHSAARDAVAAFCAAHKKLEEAAGAGRAGDDATYPEVVEAVKASRPAPPATSAAPAAPPAKK